MTDSLITNSNVKGAYFEMANFFDNCMIITVYVRP